MLALGAKRLLKHDGMRFLQKGVPIEFGPQDAIICWGAHVPKLPNTPVLNASYEFQDVASLNIRGLQKLRSLGHSAFQLSQMRGNSWEQAIQKLGDTYWWPKRASGQMIAVPEVPGYGMAGYNFTTVNRVLMFGAECINGKPTHNIETVWQLLGMEFGEVTYGTTGSRGEGHVLKINTAPALTDAEVTLVATRMQKWLTEARSGETVMAKLEKLLE
jgi:hypothetical protein